MTTPRVAASVPELLSLLDGVAHVAEGMLVVDDEARMRSTGIHDLSWSATFSEDAEVVEAARWIVWEASQLLGAPSASIHDLYLARGRGEVGGLHGAGRQPAHPGLRHGRRHVPGGPGRSTPAR